MRRMGSLKALQEWCRIQCEDYHDVAIKDMSTSFRDGLAFCALIHRYRPDLIDFSSLSKENVYENNRLAFEVAETQLGIPALLDPEDMVSMRVPDRLSIITYVSQYYNFFNNKSHANPPCMKRPSPIGPISELAQKKPALPLDDKINENETGAEAKRSTLSSTCSVCNKHVHLVQRFLVDGKLFHRNCFRCTECHSTLLPGSYKLVSNSGSLVCTHHFARHSSSNQNGRPDLSKKPELSVKPVLVESARIGRSPVPHSSSVSCKTEEDLSSKEKTTKDTPIVTPVIAIEDNSIEEASVTDNEAEAQPSTPPNPFDDSDEEEEDDSVKEEQIETPIQHTVNGDLPSAPVSQSECASRPVPAPRRVSDPTPPPRPAPRVRLPPTASSATASEPHKPLIAPKPRERSRSPGSLSGGSQKSKDPPWLALVQSQESKKKKAPPPPVPGLATPPNLGSVSSLKGDDSRSSTPPVPANPFEDDEDDVIEEEEEAGDESVPTTVAATHPWYSIRRAADSPAADTSPSRGSTSRSESPAGGKSKKRPAPRVPPPPTLNQALSPSQPSSCSASPALSTESLSSGSEQRSAGGASSDQEQTITKSTSEPSIASPDNSVPSSNDHQASLSPCPPHVPSYASSAPATPQAGRSSHGSVAPSPLASNHKRICKENPFNRKASPSPAKSKGKPPKGPRPARPPAPGHGFPLIKRKVQSDQYIPTEDIYGEMNQLEKQLDELEQRGVELEKKLRDNPNDEDEEHLLVDWFTLIHEKHLLVRREAELVYTAKQQNLEERQADVEYELRCLLNKPEKDWTEEDKTREQQLMAELVTIIEQRNQIVNTMDQDRQREEEEDKLMEAMLKKKDFSKEPECNQQKKKGAKFKPIKVFKRLSHKGEPGKSPSPRKEKS
ncbi:MICAL-like protein 1 isoform X2 [Periophthalmus magnuspinnatus]|uniref:MICAL-like protein 1 isoform X2 n=1 Tax=Periophthalmus magnuspinnatus TaxID=409849 RepID=UPI00145B982F|nr:MICAL-like protein 1 isoform X2 [Periophthalmus magnuspinnatus]